MSIRATGINQPSRNKAGYKDAADFFTKSSKTACQPGGIHISCALAAIRLLIRHRRLCAGLIAPGRRSYMHKHGPRWGDRGREGPAVLPSLRTVRAVLPHTALQSVVSSSGLARSPGCLHGEQSQVCEECIGPALVIDSAVARSRPLFMLSQHSPQPPSYESVYGRECTAVGMFKVLEPALEDWVEAFSDLAQALA